LWADLESHNQISSISGEAENIGFLPYFWLKFSTRAHTTRGPVVVEFFSRASHSLFRPSKFPPVTRVCRKIEKKIPTAHRFYIVFVLFRAIDVNNLSYDTTAWLYHYNFFMVANRNERDVDITMMMSCVFYIAEYPRHFSYTSYSNRGQYNSSIDLLSARDPMRIIKIYSYDMSITRVQRTTPYLRIIRLLFEEYTFLCLFHALL